MVKDAQRNKLTGDRRAGASPPAGVRLSDGLGSMRIAPELRLQQPHRRAMSVFPTLVFELMRRQTTTVLAQVVFKIGNGFGQRLATGRARHETL